MIDFHDKMMEEKELLGMSMKESIRQKEERTKIKICFVCYNHGTGGETLAQQISLLDQCNNLSYKKINGRTITNDIFNSAFRRNKFNKQPLPDPSKKWYVVASHFPPEKFKDMNAEKFYVVINDPITKEHDELMHQNIYEKVWTHKFYDVLEIRGQIESDGYDPKDPFFADKIKGGISYGELRCLYEKQMPTKENVDAQLKIRTDKHNNREKFVYTNSTDLMAVDYANTLKPNFYQQFTKKIQDHLTKHS